MTRPKPYTHHHKDGSLWAEGWMLDGEMHGAWVFYRKDGTRLRSGSFDRGEQTGEWTTYDKAGEPYKTTHIKPKSKPKAALAKAKSPAPRAASRKPARGGARS